MKTPTGGSASPTAEILLSRLDGVRATGPGRWMTRCPSHDDRNPSLSIQETHDGILLVNCFAGCEPSDVVTAVGMTLADLFPHELECNRSRKPYLSARDVLLILDEQTLAVTLLAGKMLGGQPLDEDESVRVGQARDRINRLRDVLRV